MQTTRRRVLPDPNRRTPKPGFIVAEHGHTHGQLSYFLWDPPLNRIHLVDGYAHATPSRSVAWSAHGIVATGLASGAIHLLDVERWTRPRSAAFAAAAAGAGGEHVASYSHAVSAYAQAQAAESGSLGTLSIRHNRACNALAFSKLDPHYLVAGYDKTRSECSLMIWDLELALSHATYPTTAGRRFPLGSEGRLDIQYTPNGTSSQPIQQLLPSETINAVDTLAGSVSLILASSNAKIIRLLDLRTRIPSSTNSPNPATPAATAYQPAVPSRLSASVLGNTPAQPTPHDLHVSWSTATRAVYHLSAAPLNAHLIASAEEGLGGTVRIWDTRYAQGDVLNFEAARGGVIHLGWDESGGNGERLGVGTRDGGVLVYDVVSGQVVTSSSSSSEPPSSEGSSWAALTHVRGASRPLQSLASYAFLPSTHTAQQNILTVCRDGAMFVDTLKECPKVASASRMGDASLVVAVDDESPVPRRIAPNVKTEQESPPVDPFMHEVTAKLAQPTVTPATTTMTTTTHDRRSVSRGRQPESAARTTLNIKQLSLTDPPSAYVVNSGTAWRHPWATAPSARSNSRGAQSIEGTGRRTSHARAAAGMRPRVQDLEMDVWAELLGEDVGVVMRRKAEAGFGLDLMANDVIESQMPTTGGLLFEWLDRFVHLMSKPAPRSAVDGFDFCLQGVCGIWTAHNGPASPRPSPLAPHSEFTTDRKQPTWSPSSAARAPLDPSLHPDYLRALHGILADRQVDFVESGLVSEGAKAPHRRLMLAVCGELTGERLDIEIERIAQTQVTKAACIALFNKKTQTAVSMLHNSKDEKHRLMGTLLMQRRIEPSSVLHMELSDPYLRAMVKSLAGDTSWGEILYDTDLPLLERIVLAIRFVGDDMLSRFLDEQARRCLDDGSLHGIVLLGLTTDGIQLIQRYLDRTGDIQTAAIIGALIPTKIGNVTRWIETYRDMLDGWKCFKARVRYDMMRGSIARYYGDNIKTPKQVVLRCNYCQKDLTGNVGCSDVTSRTYCANCSNRLPKCSICLLQIDTAPEEDDSGSTLANALVFCQNCHHGGHQKHIMEWFEGGQDAEGHAECPVAGCTCTCSRL